MQVRMTMERSALYREGTTVLPGVDVNVVLEIADDTLPTQQISLIQTAVGAAMRFWEKATEDQQEAASVPCFRCNGAGKQELAGATVVCGMCSGSGTMDAR